ncbi:MAG: cupin domain-containing protein [Actinomycetota bacterium]
MDRVLKITPSERVAGDPTPGIAREQAFASDHLWAGLARTESGVVSGWHHHGDNETTVYVEAGAFRIEFGPGGSEVVEGEPGDFLVIGKGVVHRESNPSDEESRLILFRTGTGPPTINVDGPSE